MGLAHLRVPGLAQGPQESAHRRGLGRAQGPQEPERLRVLGLVKGPQGLERLRVRLMESPQLGELLESLPEAVLFPHLHRQKP